MFVKNLFGVLCLVSWGSLRLVRSKSGHVFCYLSRFFFPAKITQITINSPDFDFTFFFSVFYFFIILFHVLAVLLYLLYRFRCCSHGCVWRLSGRSRGSWRSRNSKINSKSNRFVVFCLIFLKFVVVSI